MSECIVCFEKPPKRNRFECHQCQKTTCTDCLLTYIQVNANAEMNFKCPGCAGSWTILDIMKNVSQRVFVEITKVWMDEHWKVIERVLPLYQRSADLKKQIRDLEKEINDKNQQAFSLSRHSMNEFQDGSFGTSGFHIPWWEHTAESQERIRLGLWTAWMKGQQAFSLRKQVEDLIQKKLQLETEFAEEQTGDTNVLFPCHSNNCPGFILANNGMCGMNCGGRVCLSCLEPKEEGHECDQDIRKSIEEVRKNSKLCPNPICRFWIQHGGGCTQMYCPQCRIFFDWETLRIIRNGAVHNPEADEDMRRRLGYVPRNIRDIPFGGFPPENGWDKHWTDLMEANDDELTSNRKGFKKFLLDKQAFIDDDSRKRKRDDGEHQVMVPRGTAIIGSVSVAYLVQRLREYLDAENQRGIDLRPIAINYLNGVNTKEEMILWYHNQTRQLLRDKEELSVASDFVNQIARLVSRDYMENMDKSPEGWIGWINKLDELRIQSNKRWAENAHLFKTTRIKKIEAGFLGFISPL